MASFEIFLPGLLQREGGEQYTWDKETGDPPTKYGITLPTLTNWRRYQCFPEDVQDLGLTEANAIYRQEYWDKVSGDDISSQILAEKVADVAVNCGVPHSVLTTQRCLNLLGNPVIADGLIGPKTVEAINVVDQGTLLQAIVTAQGKYYRAIVSSKPEKAPYLVNWLKRAAWPLSVV